MQFYSETKTMIRKPNIIRKQKNVIRKPKRIFGNQAQRRSQAVIQNPTALVLHGHYICQEPSCPSPTPAPHPTDCHSKQAAFPLRGLYICQEISTPAPSDHPTQPTVIQNPAAISQPPPTTPSNLLRFSTQLPSIRNVMTPAPYHHPT